MQFNFPTLENKIIKGSQSVYQSLKNSDSWSDYFELLTDYPDLLDFSHKLGNTSLIELPTPNSNVSILAKCEWENPFGSVKDRTAFILILNYLLDIKRGYRTPGIILEYSGGSLAISLAKLCSKLSLPLHLVLSDGTAPIIVESLKSYGCSITLVNREQGFLAVIREAERLASMNSDFRFLYQHENDLNWKFHEITTGKEILMQYPSNINCWIASIGTGGTFSGVFNALLSRSPDLEACAVTPSELPYGSLSAPNGLPKYAGSGGLGWGIKQRFVAMCASKKISYSTVSYSSALKMIAKVYKETGLRIGSSAAANYLIAKERASEMQSGTIITVFACKGSDMEWHKAMQE